MNIVTWNCNGALRKKSEQIDSLGADIIVIQECEDPAQSSKKYKEWAGEYLWIGTSKNKGVGVFPRNGNRVKKLDWYGEYQIRGLSKYSSSKWTTDDLKLFLPFRINDSINAVAVWTKGSDSEAFAYIGQVWKYMQIHAKQLAESEIIIIGDFNSNTIWDKDDRWWNHSDVVDELDGIGIKSLYHSVFNEEQGAESIPTFYHQRKQKKAYHIDYVFCSKHLLPNCSIQVGDFEKWIEVSDHMPIKVSIDSI